MCKLHFEHEYCRCPLFFFAKSPINARSAPSVAAREAAYVRKRGHIKRELLPVQLQARQRRVAIRNVQPLNKTGSRPHLSERTPAGPATIDFTPLAAAQMRGIQAICNPWSFAQRMRKASGALARARHPAARIRPRSL